MKKISEIILLLSCVLLISACNSNKKAPVQNDDTTQVNLPDTTKPVVQKDTVTTITKQEIVASDKPVSKTNYEIVQIETSFGNILIWLYDQTPKHKKNFLKLAKSGFYNGTTFHRIIQNFMIQGGDPNSKDNDPSNDGQGGPNYTIEAEFNPGLTHIYGALAGARMGDQVNPEKKSSGSQFYIVNNKAGTHFLDQNYTVFGQVIKGMEAVETISIQAKGQNDRPVADIKMKLKVVNISKEDLQSKYNFKVPQ